MCPPLSASLRHPIVHALFRTFHNFVAFFPLPHHQRSRRDSQQALLCAAGRGRVDHGQTCCHIRDTKQQTCNFFTGEKKQQLSAAAATRCGLKAAGAGSGGSTDPASIKFGAEVSICIWHSCRRGVKIIAMTTCLTVMHYRPRACIHIQRCCVLTTAFIFCIYRFLPLYCINSQHDFKGWGENQRVMLLHDKT